MVDTPKPEPEPFPVGFPAALESAGAVAAPLLAGFSVTLVSVLVTAGNGRLRYPGISLSLLMAAVVAFVAAIQSAFWLRQFSPVSLADVQQAASASESSRTAEAVLALHRRGAKKWTGRFSFAYRAGILCLLAGTGMCLVPRAPISSERWAALSIAALGVVGEVVWIFSGRLLRGFESYNPSSVPDYPSWMLEEAYAASAAGTKPDYSPRRPPYWFRVKVRAEGERPRLVSRVILRLARVFVPRVS